MSHREARDSESKRHRSRFDREPSPKRSRRDGKPAPERLPNSNNLDNRNPKDDLPLESSLPAEPKLESGARRKETDRKPDGEHGGKKHSSKSTEGPRSRSHFQPDECGNPARFGRSSARNATGERGWWRDSKDQRNGRTENKNVSNETWRRDDRAKGQEQGSWGHDGFFEIEADAPPERKRPAFRENKVQVENSEHNDKAPTETRKSSHAHPDRPAEESGKYDSGRNGRYLDRSQKPFGGGNYRREPQRDGFPSRERYHRDGGNYRRGDRFGGRPGFHSGGARVEKWKHDLYHESNRSPTQKNEEDQIAKVEALLSS